MDIFDQAKAFIPNFSGSLIVSFVAWVIIFIVVCIAVGFGTYWYMNRKKFNKDVVIFEKVNGRFEPIGKDKAMEMKVGTGGDTMFVFRKSKQYEPRPSIQTGRNTYWFFRKEDGELINFGLADMDEQMRELDAHFLDKEMRYARAGLQKNLKDRYDKIGFWEKYGGLVAYIGLIAIVGIMTFLLFDKYIELADTVNTSIEASRKVMELAKEILGNVDTIQGGSGIKPA